MAHSRELSVGCRGRYGDPDVHRLGIDYFTGDWRVRQLGYSSSINNLTLVLATVATGYLANVDWHLPFLVYTLPGIALVLTPL